MSRIVRAAKLFRCAMLVAFTLVALFATASTARAQAVATVRIATNPIEAGAEVYYAKDMGFFAKAGLDVEIQPGQSGSAIAAAVASNAVDFGYSDLGALAKAHTKGIDFVVVAPATMWTRSARLGALVVTRKSPIHSAKDLGGKTLSVPGLGTAAEYGPRAWIDKNGGDANAAKYIEMPYAAMPAALSAGRIDVAYVAEPYLTIATEGDARVLGYAFDAIAPEFLQTAWFTSARWGSGHPDLVRRFVAALKETAIWANQKQNQPKTAEILVKYTKTDAALVAKMKRAHYGESVTASSIQPSIDVIAKYANFAPFPADQLIYHSP